jgi:hypothetical protein
MSIEHVESRGAWSHGQLHVREKMLGMVPRWKERRFVLTAERLSIHKMSWRADDPHDQETLKRSIVLSTASLDLERTPWHTKTNENYGFRIMSADGELEVATPNRQHTHALVAALKQAGVQSTNAVDRAFHLRTVGEQCSDILDALRGIESAGFVGRQRDIRALGRILDACALALIAANMLTLHAFAGYLLSAAAFLFLVAATVEIVTCEKMSGRCSCKSLAASLGDMLFFVATLAILLCIIGAHASGWFLQVILHSFALVVEGYLFFLVAIKASAKPQPLL